MSDPSKRRGTIACPRCKAPMEEVVRIAPVQTEPGLIGYECSACGYVTSILTPPQSPRGRGMTEKRTGDNADRPSAPTSSRKPGRR